MNSIASRKSHPRPGSGRLRGATIFTILIILFFPILLGAEEIVLSVQDFTVESERQEYTHIGKGVSRLVAMELRKAENITIVEREKLKKVLDEQRLSLSGLTEEDELIRIGRLLTADYLVLGDIIDMAGPVMIYMRLVDVRTGELVLQDEIVEELDAYDYIASSLARSVIEEFGRQPEPSTMEKIVRREEKKEAAVITLSRGIDAYDREDVSTAKRELEEVKVLDPENETADYYLAKLVINTAKYRFLPEPYYFFENPAALGGIGTDVVLYNQTNSAGQGWCFFFREGDYDYRFRELSENRYTLEDDIRSRLGYYFPLGENDWGAGVEVLIAEINGNFDDSPDLDDARAAGRQFYGGSFALGKKLGSISLGAACSLFLEDNSMWSGDNPIYEDISRLSYAVSTGIQVNMGRITQSVQVGWSSATYDSVDPVTKEIEFENESPLFAQAAIIWALNNRRTFIVLNEVGDFYLGSGNFFVRVLPAVEHYFWKRLSLRAGAELSAAHFEEEGENQVGFGALGGLTLLFPGTGWSLDLNMTYRERPSRVVIGELYPSFLWSLSVSREGIFFGEH